MPATIFWAGDSTVKQNTIASYPQTGIGQALPLYLKKEIRIENHAENGRSTKSFIDEQRLAPIYNHLRADDFLFIQFGHNDEKPDANRHTEPFSTYQEHLTRFINVARNRKAYPVLITPLYRRLFDEAGVLCSDTHGDYPKACMELGKRLDVPVIDLCGRSEAFLKECGDEASKRYFMQLPPHRYPNYPEGKTDNTHLCYDGAVLFAGMIAEGLRMLGGVYADLLLPELSEENSDPLAKAYEK